MSKKFGATKTLDHNHDITLDDTDLASVGGAQKLPLGVPFEVLTGTDNSPSAYGGWAGAIAGGTLGARLGSRGGWIPALVGTAVGASIGGAIGETGVQAIEDFFDGGGNKPLLDEDEVMSYVLSGSTFEEVEAIQKGGGHGNADARADIFYDRAGSQEFWQSHNADGTNLFKTGGGFYGDGREFGDRDDD